MKYFSTRGGDQRLSFEEVNLRFEAIYAILIENFTDSSHRSRPKWRIIHPRINTLTALQLGNSMELIFLHRSLCRHSITVHLPGRDFHWGTKITRRKIIQDIPSSGCDPSQKTEWQDIRAWVISRTYVCFQRRGTPATWEFIRVFFTPEECTENPRREVGKVDCCWCHKWWHGEVCRFTFLTGFCIMFMIEW